MRIFERLLSIFPFVYARLSFAMICLVAAGCSSSNPDSLQTRMDDDQKYIDKIAAAGGKAEKNYYKMLGQEGYAWEVDLHGANITDELIDTLVDVRIKTSIDFISALNFSGSNISDEQLGRLDTTSKSIRTVLKLNLSDTQITDDGLDKLNNFYCLQNLNLKGTKVTPAAVQRLKKRIKDNPEVNAFFKKGPKVEM